MYYHIVMKRKSIIFGILAACALILFYFIVMGLASGSMEETLTQFRQMWYWIFALAGGFGVQVGLFIYLKMVIKHKVGRATAITATSTGTSGVGMIACCAHHLTEILPIVGLSGAAIFLTNYQIPLIILGIIMNIVGATYMLRVLKKIL